MSKPEANSSALPARHFLIGGISWPTRWGPGVGGHFQRVIKAVDKCKYETIKRGGESDVLGRHETW